MSNFPAIVSKNPPSRFLGYNDIYPEKKNAALCPHKQFLASNKKIQKTYAGRPRHPAPANRHLHPQ